MPDTTPDTVTINAATLAELTHAAQQHLEYLEEWESAEAGNYPDGEYAATMASLAASIAEVQA